MKNNYFNCFLFTNNRGCDLIKKNPNKITLKIDRFEIWKFSKNRKETYIKSFPLRDF